MKKAVGIFGGTFDPVHNGHLRSALEVLQQFDLDHIRLIPSARPPHREQPQATPEQRLMMLHLAVKNSQSFVVDDRELKREGPSYTVDTLTSLRAEFPDTPLYLILGSDAFIHLSTWHQWQQLLTLSHIVVMQRPDQPLSLRSDMQNWYQEHLASTEHNDLLAGKIWPVTLTQLNISATAIREAVAKGHSPEFLMPDPAVRLIEQLGLYQRQV
jgi:nicotinate-nucleotide adenylyltransferase